MGKESVSVDFQANFLPQLFRSAVFIFSLMAVVYFIPIPADVWVAFGTDHLFLLWENYFLFNTFIIWSSKRLQLNSMFDKESNESQPIFRSYRVKKRSISSFQRRCAKNAPGRSFNCSKGNGKTNEENHYIILRHVFPKYIKQKIGFKNNVAK